MEENKYKHLRTGIVYDLLGMATLLIPVIGPFLDIIWAPIAAKKMGEMYKGTSSKVAMAIVFIEELLPISDVVPTFTLMWLYTYIWKNQPTKYQPIKIRSNE